MLLDAPLVDGADDLLDLAQPNPNTCPRLSTVRPLIDRLEPDAITMAVAGLPFVYAPKIALAYSCLARARLPPWRTAPPAGVP